MKKFQSMHGMQCNASDADAVRRSTCYSASLAPAALLHTREYSICVYERTTIVTPSPWENKSRDWTWTETIRGRDGRLVATTHQRRQAAAGEAG